MGNTAYDLVPLLHASGILRPLTATLTPQMYPLKEHPTENWLYFSFAAFRQLASTISPQRFAAVGTGNGVDAIGAALLFPSLTEIYLTDIDATVLSQSQQNLEGVLSAHGLSRAIHVFAGDLATVLPDQSIDLCHANLPAIPQGTPHTPWLEYPDVRETPWRQYGLDLQVAYFRGVRAKLAPGGIAIAILGGRMPTETLRELVTSAELTYRELCTGFRKQTEACHALHGYAALEQRHGATFDFYPFDRTQAFLDASGIHNPTGTLSGDTLKHLLRNYRMSAAAALELHERGMSVGHTVHVIAGVR